MHVQQQCSDFRFFFLGRCVFRPARHEPCTAVFDAVRWRTSVFFFVQGCQSGAFFNSSLSLSVALCGALSPRGVFPPHPSCSFKLSLMYLFYMGLPPLKSKWGAFVLKSAFYCSFCPRGTLSCMYVCLVHSIFEDGLGSVSLTSTIFVCTSIKHAVVFFFRQTSPRVSLCGPLPPPLSLTPNLVVVIYRTASRPRADGPTKIIFVLTRKSLPCWHARRLNAAVVSPRHVVFHMVLMTFSLTAFLSKPSDRQTSLCFQHTA